jgi:hypothetical protein
MAELPGVEPVEAVIRRLESALAEGVAKPPKGEFGHATVWVADVWRLIAELRRRL